jgi:hypothetical protein
VELLIEKGTDFEIPNSLDGTALYNISMNEYTEIVSKSVPFSISNSTVLRKPSSTAALIGVQPFSF